MSITARHLRSRNELQNSGAQEIRVKTGTAGMLGGRRALRLLM
jgi:hypothetical protein